MTSIKQRVELFLISENRDGIAYITGEKEPYTGTLVSYYENGKVEAIENYKEGRLEGKCVCYYENGQIKEARNYKTGKPCGKYVAYYENGQIRWKENYKAGKQEIEVVSYYENGQVEFKRNYKASKEQISCYENNHIKENYEVDKEEGEYFRYYKKASKLEISNPKVAFKLYSKLERGNKIFRLRVLIIDILLPVIAFLLAAWLTLSFQLNEILITIFIWIGPTYLISLKRGERQRGFSEWERYQKFGESRFNYFASTYVIIPFLSFVMPLFIYGFVVFVTVTVVLLFLSVTSYVYHLIVGISYRQASGILLHQYVTRNSMIIIFIIIYFILASDAKLKELFSIKKILLRIKVNNKAIFYVFKDMFLLLILYGGSVGIFYNMPIYGIIISLIAGLTSGIFNASSEKDIILGRLYKIAKLRCLIKLNRKTEANFMIDKLQWEDYINKEFSMSNENRELLNIMRLIAEDKSPNEIKKCLKNFTIKSYDKYKQLYLHNIRQTEILLGFNIQSDSNLLKEINPGLFPASRVILKEQHNKMKDIDVETRKNILEHANIMDIFFPRLIVSWPLWILALIVKLTASIGFLFCLLCLLFLGDWIIHGISQENITGMIRTLIFGISFISFSSILIYYFFGRNR
ncbi:hypothetical protein PM10SUCC1_00290 [Propionigenium maris DSM 9537]|uniref:Antitoxin component YwqK of the YwqJK toxin-antitoxin module n=1 Tax=Propionigenium maris DSM 9537 TaxID=1123000 RepID=A0A9W6LLA9_9FUSO|nr:toxin-antitoxin system YwqK family antitoxin [Propionigenium maris]GLI54514.1 hypothetical protein PM10SUCC1_00290 [Propionigenium maris DSM 9537]